MKSQGLWKNVVIAFGIALIFYIVAFTWIEHRRVAKGPWEVFFLTDNSGAPAVLVVQPTLKISQRIVFPTQNMERQNFVHAMRFDMATPTTPFGPVIFQDPTFLPGTVTLNLFSHEVELLPRVLIVDKKEIPWGSNEISIVGQGKLPLPDVVKH